MPPPAKENRNPTLGHHLRSHHPWASNRASHLGQPPSLIPALPASMSGPLCLLSAWSQRGAVKTEGRAHTPLLPPSRAAHCIQELLPDTSVVLGFHALFSLCSHIDMPAPRPPQGLCPCSVLCLKCSSPGVPLTLLPSGLCSYVSVFHLNTRIHSTPMSTLLCPAGADCGA